jgi:hypothetical protein
MEDRSMTGLLVLALFGLWIWAVFKLSRWIGGQVQGGRWRWPIAALVFAALLPLPVIDELIGGRQLDSLCRDKAVMKIDEAKIKGRRVRYSAEPLDQRVPAIAIPVTFTLGVLRDLESNEILGSRGRYNAKGGILVQAMGASESDSPMFAQSYCAPTEGWGEAAKRVGFTIIN